MWPPQKAKPGAVKPHLVVKLKPGYSLHPKGKAFVSREGRMFSPGEELPSGIRIVLVAPALAGKSSGALSEDERNLLSYVHIVFPKGLDPQDYVDVIRSWECVAEVRSAPKISLP